MEWINELEKEAWNVIIDELVWHLREGRVPVAIRRQFTPRRGIEFCFHSAQPSFFSIEGSFLEEHWSKAVAIIRECSELSDLKTYDAEPIAGDNTG